MKCEECPYYTEGDHWNCCEITSAVNFFTLDDCKRVDDKSTQKPDGLQNVNSCNLQSK